MRATADGAIVRSRTVVCAQLNVLYGEHNPLYIVLTFREVRLQAADHRERKFALTHRARGY